MRLKFRAYHIKTKQMFEVDEINHISSWNVHGLIGVNGIDHTIGISGEDCVLMQFTGLLDKNGQEIYKGDIVKRDDKSDGRYWRFAVVELNPDIQFNCSLIKEVDGIKNSADCVFRYGHFSYKDTENYLTVIGNIYENPELVKQ